MILLELFLTFLKVGAVSFGGGYGMISLLTEEVVARGWLTEAEFMNFIAVAESTPGPIAVNMASFVGAVKGGEAMGAGGSFFGAALATLGVVLPAFVIIRLIASVIKGLLKYAGVNAFLSGIRPVVVGLIAATGACMALSVICGIGKIGDAFRFDYKAAVIFVAVALTAFVYKKIKKKRISAIYLILLSAVLGMIFYGLLG